MSVSASLGGLRISFVASNAGNAAIENPEMVNRMKIAVAPANRRGRDFGGGVGGGGGDGVGGVGTFFC